MEDSSSFSSPEKMSPDEVSEPEVEKGKEGSVLEGEGGEAADVMRERRETDDGDELTTDWIFD